MESRALDEYVLPDDYPVYYGYTYVIDDNRVVTCDLSHAGSTIADLRIRLKRLYGMKGEDIKRCDLVGRGLLS